MVALLAAALRRNANLSPLTNKKAPRKLHEKHLEEPLLPCEFQPLLDLFYALDNLVVAELLLRRHGRIVSKMLHHGCLTYLEMRDPRFQFAHIIPDRRYVCSYRTQVFQDEVIHVFHRLSLLPQSMRERLLHIPR